MDLTPNAEQQQFVDAAASFLLRAMPVSRLHGSAEQRLPDRRLTAEQGWCEIGLGEEAGGLGLSPVEEVLVLREIGRSLGPTHVLHNAIAAQLCAHAGDVASARAFAGGIARASLAVADAPVSVDGQRLSGAVRLYDCHDADHLLFLDTRGAWLLAMADAPPLRPCLDKSVTMATADLSDFPVVASIEGRALHDRFIVSVAAMLQGMAEATRDMITAYAKIRETFGRPIGSYQAVRHPIAEMAARCEAAKALLFYAALSLAEGRSDAAAQVSAALIVAEKAAMQNADVNIQLHGGIGVTDELDAHFYLKRGHVLTRWCGLPRDHVALIAATDLAPL